MFAHRLSIYIGGHSAAMLPVFGNALDVAQVGVLILIQEIQGWMETYFWLMLNRKNVCKLALLHLSADSLANQYPVLQMGDTCF